LIDPVLVGVGKCSAHARLAERAVVPAACKPHRVLDSASPLLEIYPKEVGEILTQEHPGAFVISEELDTI
jgi:hypothetical protein